MPAIRIAFADANWLISTYHKTKDTPQVLAWKAIGHSTLIVSRPVMAEAQCNFWRIGNRWPALDSDWRAGLLVDCNQSFESLVALAEPLFRRYAPRCNVGTLDLLHIAAAKRHGCQWFLSFDRNSGCRAVAKAEGLKVFPAMDDSDWRIFREIKP